jgi:hypothetical protein
LFVNARSLDGRRSLRRSWRVRRNLLARGPWMEAFLVLEFFGVLSSGWIQYSKGTAQQVRVENTPIQPSVVYCTVPGTVGDSDKDS